MAANQESSCRRIRTVKNFQDKYATTTSLFFTPGEKAQYIAFIIAVYL